MDTAGLIAQARALQMRIERYARSDHSAATGEAAKAQVCECLRQYAGPRSSFLKQAEAARGHDTYLVGSLVALLDSFIEYHQAGLAAGDSPERRAQLDVVSDFLAQAQTILEHKEYHPAAAAMLIGAALEEFLRTWVEAEALQLGKAKPGIEAYSTMLRNADLISKQDVKDITSWGGARNHAAHGQWDEVSDRQRVRLMIEGVNLFMRRYSK